MEPPRALLCEPSLSGCLVQLVMLTSLSGLALSLFFLLKDGGKDTLAAHISVA